MTRRASQIAAALACVAVLLVSAEAFAQAEVGSQGSSVPAEARAEEAGLALSGERPGDARPSGTVAMFASAAYPGLGQLLNDAEPKAAVVSAVEAFLIARLVIEDRRTRNSLRHYRETSDERYYDEYSVHFDRRQTLVWWAAVAALYGLADAYVDAHLTGFDDPEPAWLSCAAGPGGDEIRLGIAFGF